MSDLITPLLHWISQNPIWSGWVIFLIAMLESLAIVGLLVPGAMVMIGFGALIANETLSFWPTVGWAIAGAVVGDSLSFLIGRHFSDRIATLWPFSKHPQRLQQGLIFFQRHGTASIALGRFIGPIRAVIPLVAGMMAMSPRRFLVANLLSAIAWAPLYLLPGIVLGTAFDQATGATVRLISFVLLLLALCWVLFWLLKRVMSRNSAKLLISLAIIFITTIGFYYYWQPGYSLDQSKITLQLETWWQQDWQLLPPQKETPYPTQQTIFNVQFSGNLKNLTQELQAQGWEASEPLMWINILKFFTPGLALQEIPVIKTRHSGNFESLIMQKMTQDGRHLLLRLWPSHFQVADQPIWLGTLSQRHQRDLYGLLFLPESDLTTPLQLIQTLPWPSQQQKNGELFLVSIIQQ